MGSRYSRCSICQYTHMSNIAYPCANCNKLDGCLPSEFRYAIAADDEEEHEIVTAVKTLERYGFKVTLESKEV